MDLLFLQLYGLSPGLWDPELFLLEPASTGVYQRDIESGEGDLIASGNKVTIEFSVTSVGGKELANTAKRGMNYSLLYSPDATFWGTALKDMHYGWSRTLLFMPGVAYGAKGVPGLVPKDDGLIVRVRVLKPSETL